MNRIAYKSNTEVCNEDGDSVWVDMFLYETDSTMTIYLYHVDSHDEIDVATYSHEENSWLEDCDWVELFHPNTHANAATSIKQVVQNCHDLLSGATPNKLPTCAYMSNDENLLTQRDHCDWDYFMSHLVKGCIK